MIQGQQVLKPKYFSDFDLLVILPPRAMPVGELDSMVRTYSKSNLAVHKYTEEILAYIDGKSEEGLVKFAENYPDYKEVTDLNTISLEDWTTLTFPNTKIEGFSPLDIYFHTLEKEHIK